MREKLDLPFPDDPQGRTYRELISERILTEAVEGNRHFSKQLLDRLEGKPTQRIEAVSNKKDRPYDLGAFDLDELRDFHRLGTKAADAHRGEN